MGWRGVTRSLIAASRAAERAKEKRARIINKAGNKLERSSSQLESEIARELERIAEIEEKLRKKPISFGQLEYHPEENHWKSRRFYDSTGQVQWSFVVKLLPDARGDGRIKDGGRGYELLSIVISRWFVLLAFRITDAHSGRATKLLNRTNPSGNKLFLVADGVAHRAIDGNLDIDVPTGTSLIASVAFPLPTGAPKEMAIEFMLKTRPERLLLTPIPEDVFDKVRAEDSMLEEVKKKIDDSLRQTRGTISSAKQQIAEMRNTKSDYSWILWVVGIFFVLVFILGHST